MINPKTIPCTIEQLFNFPTPPPVPKSTSPLAGQGIEKLSEAKIYTNMVNNVDPVASVINSAITTPLSTFTADANTAPLEPTTAVKPPSITSPIDPTNSTITRSELQENLKLISTPIDILGKNSSKNLSAAWQFAIAGACVLAVILGVSWYRRQQKKKAQKH